MITNLGLYVLMISLLSTLTMGLKIYFWQKQDGFFHPQKRYFVIVSFLAPCLIGLLLMTLLECFIIAFSAHFWINKADYHVWAILLGILLVGILHISLTKKYPIRACFELIIKGLLCVCVCITILITLGILLSIIFESIRFFQFVPLTEFLFGMTWSPQSSSVGDVKHHFGIAPLLCGSVLIALIAMLIAGPVGLFAAIFTAFYASSSVRHILKPILEMLAGIPTVVYGFFAVTFVAPLMRKIGLAIHLDIATESAIVAGLVMGVMIIPFISSLSDDVLYSLPETLKDGSLGLGATYEETIQKVLIPSAVPGIASAFLLAISRAMGETMLVVMAAGMSANLTLNPFQPVTTVTVQIVSLLTGDQEFNSPKTLVAFALGLALLILTFALNFIAFKIVRRCRAKYEAH